MKHGLIALIYLLVLGFCVRVSLAMRGVMEAFNPHLPSLPAPGYLWPVLLHVAYGIFLFLCVVATGTTGLRTLHRRINLSREDIAIAGYLAGLLACLAVSLVALAGVPGQVTAGLIVTATLLAFFRQKAFRSWPRAGQLAIIVLLATALGGFLALMWRPATADFAGSLDLSDLSVYMGWFHSLKISVFPFYNLGVEGDTLSGYFNQLQTFYALALDALPGFDIYLFLSASLASFLVLSIAWLLRALVQFRLRQEGGNHFTAVPLLAVCGLLVASTWYPSWILDSPPAAFLAPISLCVAYLVHRAGDNPIRLILAFLLTVLGTLLSKVVALAVLGSYAGVRLLQGAGRGAKPVHIALAIAVGAAAAYYVLGMIQLYGGIFFSEWAPGPESWHRFQLKGWNEFGKVVPVLLKDAGLVLIVIGALKTRDIALFVAAALGVTCHFVFPFLFTPTPAALTTLVAGYLVVTRETPSSATGLFLAGAAMSLPYFTVRDPGLTYIVVIWTLAVGFSTLVALQPALRKRPDPVLDELRKHSWLHITSAAAVLVFLLVAMSSGDFRIGKKHHQIVPVSLYDIWVHARLLTPPDALLFTDQTGDNEDRLSGWNDYALLARRQFYLSSWNISSLRNDADARRRRLSMNDAVLSGEASPVAMTFSRRYSSYYAVVAKDRTVPPGFQLVYGNSDYALYEIGTVHSVHR